MAFWSAFDKPTDDRHAHPHDPDDLDRCLRLLAAVPSKSRSAPQTYALMREVIDLAEVKA